MRFRSIGVFLLVSFPVTVLDQLSKKIAIQGGLSVAENRGIAFGLFQSLDWLIFVSAILVVGLFWLRSLRSFSSRLEPLSFGLLIGGASSNLLDRALRGSVVDFLQFGRGLRFNLADVAIVGGLLLFSWKVVFGQMRGRSI